MKPALQAKLLHVLQDAQFTKLGSNKPINVDVRVVAATNRDLEAMMLRGEFREDLYYRLKVIEVTVPPLRERRDEISHLTDFFIDRYARRYNRPVRQLSDELRQLFQTYDWPGNIRELENMIKRIVILQDEQLVVARCRARRGPSRAYAAAGVGARAPASMPPRDADAPDEDDEADDEDGAAGRVAVAHGAGRLAPRRRREGRGASKPSARSSRTRSQVHWNRRRAAEQLGVSYKTLLNKIKECGISSVSEYSDELRTSETVLPEVGKFLLRVFSLRH